MGSVGSLGEVTEDEQGIIPRFCGDMFQRIRDLSTTREFAVKVSLLEIYNGVSAARRVFVCVPLNLRHPLTPTLTLLCQ